MYDYYDEITKFEYEIGEFFAMKYSRGLRDPKVLEVPWKLARQIEDLLQRHEQLSCVQELT